MSDPMTTSNDASGMLAVTRGDFLLRLRRVNAERYSAWVGDGQDGGVMFDAIELGGEVGELLNVVKKLEREARGWRGSRATASDFADECGDVLICLDKLARRFDVDLATATAAKFNATSEKQGFPHRITHSPKPGEVERLREALKRCAQRFAEYAQSHLEKKTPEGHAKAARNAEMVEMCEQALGRISTPTNSAPAGGGETIAPYPVDERAFHVVIRNRGEPDETFVAKDRATLSGFPARDRDDAHLMVHSLNGVVKHHVSRATALATLRPSSPSGMKEALAPDAVREAAQHLLYVGEFYRTDDTESALRSLRAALANEGREPEVGK